MDRAATAQGTRKELNVRTHRDGNCVVWIMPESLRNETPRRATIPEGSEEAIHTSNKLQDRARANARLIRHQEHLRQLRADAAANAAAARDLVAEGAALEKRLRAIFGNPARTEQDHTDAIADDLESRWMLGVDRDR